MLFRSHPLEAASIVATITGDQEILSAAVLHDVVEDTDVTIEQLRKEFGNRVAHLVRAETASAPAGTSWRIRREGQVKQLREADYDCKIVAIGDKLSNLRALSNDYRLIGDKLWSRFHAPQGKVDIEWYYRSLAGALFELSETLPYQEYVSLLDKTFGKPDYEEASPVDMSDYEESGGGFFATSYNSLDGISMVKFYNPDVSIAVPRRELQMAHAVFGMGIPTPMPGRLVTDGIRFGAEFRRISPKESFARYVSNRPESYEDIGKRFAHLCLALHNTPCDSTLFESEKTNSIKVVSNCPHLSDGEKRRFIDMIDSLPDRHTCLHGDMHIGNVITTALDNDVSACSSQQDFWIDMGDFRWGNPEFDLGMFYLACCCNPEELTQHLYHLSNEMMRRIWDVFVDEYYGHPSSKEKQDIERLLRPFAALRLIHFGTVGSMQPHMLEFIRNA